ncbi:general secretion pathway protein GspF [Thiohalorhabdus denitrificans]|uniref:General secretion pathway protein F n=1 Tax=Thiohalorhabdus denitrificans TaxID=381306 RepID=A0A0P9CM22_9GAMM|nr:type II secretion system inner membrane protein GspF [Thiohalorhabdus denitrificans]KPV40115.1 general secretion pathway protein GspF [Thiohalorhabdus denitrificans]SCY16298.1 general secretion pathway protein F [Thiohalorhabdus denitrificans]
MAAFEYQALDARGRNRKGILTGDSPRQIRAQLRDQGLYPVEVQPVAEQGTRQGRPMLGGRVSASGLALLTRQLATLVRAGMPLEEALRALGEQVSGRQLQSVVAGVRAQITEGATLTEALGSFPRTFPELYRVMVEAGEASGRLEEVLDRLADYTEQRQAMRQKLGVALIYPILVTVVAVLVVVALLTYVVPEVVRVFESTGQTLPLLTRGLIASSDFLRANGLLLVVLLGGAALLATYALRRPRVRYAFDRMLLRLPFIGRLSRTINSARLARTLAILTESGVPLLEAIRIGGRVVRNQPIREAVEEAAVTVREGGRLHTALGQSGYFPPLMIHMLSAGEESGELEKMLERAASNQERELESAVSAATALMEPVLILVMGGIVLVIVLAILLPIFEMNQMVG